ncbi:hypothetical protein Cgig2_014194 [Carnegiea gigantea]|uniref:Uncharacterized protein n=1 Tax=Carnegiea gigantea TaxID=171969 RepID=A0A9Q1JYP4_9CARY|nr:hypothetical protein Cgig2_014194 [Carnegiea gigantea]
MAKANGLWALLERCEPPRLGVATFETAFPPFRDTEAMADYIRETFKWHLRRASRPPRLLPEDYRDLCSSFTLPDAEEAACEFDIPEIIQATFYAMVVSDAMELSAASRDMVGDLKSTLKGLRWITFESWLSVNKHPLLEVQLHRQGHLGGGLGLVSDQEESLR